MDKIKKIILMIFFFTCSGFVGPIFGMENIFYIFRTDVRENITAAKEAIQSLKSNYKAINILIPQSYVISENGIVYGFVDPELAEFANNHALKVMPLVTNSGFDKNKTHQFLMNPIAVNRAIQFLINACNQHHYFGIQLDFEMIPIRDKEALTHFYQLVAQQLHQHGYKVSYAVAPVFTDSPSTSFFQKKIYDVWEGAYDLKALSESGDFVSVMAYDQHGQGTTPGPTATIDWVENVVKHMLQYVPAQKFSLGIPLYSDYWFTDRNLKNQDKEKIITQAQMLSYNDLQYLAKKYHVSLRWDDNYKVSYAFFMHHYLNEYFFAEDVNSFKAILALVKKYDLRGFSAFALGMEDPRIWDIFFSDNKMRDMPKG